MARPRIAIDPVAFKKLCGLQCTLEEIAAYFECSPDTIERWSKRTFKKKFEDIFSTLSASGRSSLRREQFRLALKGDRTMLIWLGKQYLGQTDKELPPPQGKVEVVVTKKYAEPPVRPAETEAPPPDDKQN
jgi:hypothetical protein